MAKSLKQASKSAQQKIDMASMIDQRGTSKDAFIFDLNELESVVGDFILNVKQGIQSAGDIVVTGKIEDITMQVQGSNNIKVLGSEHVIYQSRGVNGTEVDRNSVHSYTDLRPPLQPIIDFVIARKLISSKNSYFNSERTESFKEFNEEAEIKKLAWAIREKIFKEGFKGHFYWDNNVEQLREDLKQKITTDISKQIKFKILNRFNQSVHDKK